MVACGGRSQRWKLRPPCTRVCLGRERERERERESERERALACNFFKVLHCQFFSCKRRMKKIETGWKKLLIPASRKWRFDQFFWWAPHVFKWRFALTKHANGSFPSFGMAFCKRAGLPNRCYKSHDEQKLG